MKKVLFMMSFAFIAVFMVSCTQRDDSTSFDEIPLKSHVDGEIFNSVSNELNKYFSSITRAADVRESDVQKILSPLVESGSEIRDEIVELGLSQQLEMTKEEISAWENLKDPELAGLAYFTHITTLCLDNDSESDNYDSVSDNYRTVTRKDMTDCLSYAIGWEAATGFWGYVSGTAGLISARTALQMGAAFISRTIGWIGVAYAMYEYGACLKNK